MPKRDRAADVTTELPKEGEPVLAWWEKDQPPMVVFHGPCGRSLTKCWRCLDDGVPVFAPDGWVSVADARSLRAAVAQAEAERDEARAEAEKLRGLLKECEWSDGPDEWGGPYCPLCKEERHKGHEPGCRLAAALSPASEAPDGPAPARKGVL